VQCTGYRVGTGKASDLPVYFGDAGSPTVLHQVGAERAACAVVTLDTPGANYRTVWAMHKHFPEIKTYVRAHDINHGINLEKAGATVVVPETLEPSMQLAANVLSQFKLPPEEINTHLDNFRKKHLRELQALAAISGGGGWSGSGPLGIWCDVTVGPLGCHMQ
jgi:voltage-gated potassium channel Kch